MVERVKEETRLDESAVSSAAGWRSHAHAHDPENHPCAVQRGSGPSNFAPHSWPFPAAPASIAGIRNGCGFANQTLRNVQDIEVCDLLTRSYGLLGVKKGTYGLSVVIPRNSLCNGSEFEFRDAEVSERRTDVIEIPFGAVPEVHEYGDFVPMKENDSGAFRSAR